MQKSPPAANPDAYVASLSGWQQACVMQLRKTARAAATFNEVVKWGHLVYFANGPVLLIRAEAERVLFGFWRGQRLQLIEPRLKAGGKYEMATLELREDTLLSAVSVRRLVKEAVALNESLGDPTQVVRKARSAVTKAAAKRPRGRR